MKNDKKWILVYIAILMFPVLAAHICSRAVTTFSENSPAVHKHTIIIDPGHGGMDGGATSCTGVLESRINLEISLRLNDLFRFLGYETRMIRTEDIAVNREGTTIAQRKISDLKERVRMANETENALLLSIHQNNFSDGQYSGAQVFYSGTHGSQTLAENLQTAMVKHLNPGSRRKTKESKGIYLMEHIQCPGVLIECGFLSNPVEEARLRDPQYQKAICAVISCTVTTYLSNT